MLARLGDWDRTSFGARLRRVLVALARAVDWDSLNEAAVEVLVAAAAACSSCPFDGFDASLVD